MVEETGISDDLAGDLNRALSFANQLFNLSIMIFIHVKPMIFSVILKDFSVPASATCCNRGCQEVTHRIHAILIRDLNPAPDPACQRHSEEGFEFLDLP
jgi:hypothetical protein